MHNKLSACGQGLLSTSCVTSPIGPMIIHACSNGLHLVRQEANTDENFSPDLSVKVEVIPRADTSGVMNKPIELCIAWLREYFRNPSGVEKMTTPPLCVPAEDKVSFTERVWLSLMADVRAGQTISYGGLAKLVHSPKAARAVGGAMAHNPFQLLVPCHRVIRSDSTMGLYAHGHCNSVKKWLLAHEGVTF